MTSSTQKQLNDAAQFSTASRLSAHYARVGPLLESSLGRIPLVSASFPGGFDAPAQWHLALNHAPSAVATLQAQTATGVRTYLALHDKAMEWATHALGAVEFYSWSPRSDNPERLAFARILLEPAQSDVAQQRLHEATIAVRTALNTMNIDAIALLDGGTGIALWVPFDDGPDYNAVRAWLHILAARVALAYPDLITTEPNTRGSDLVHIHVSKNAPGSFTVIPYSARGGATLPVSLPILWSELGAVQNGSISIDTLPKRINEAGDVFALERERIGTQRFEAVSTESNRVFSMPLPAPAVHSRGHVIAAATQILSDGKTRSAEQILEEAVARGILPATFNKKLVYTALIEYITRARGGGRKPYIVQDAERNFRLNEPPDDWPGSVPPAAAPNAQTQALIDRLAAASTGNDPTAFEVAVCDAFSHFGFAATHLGGAKAPDGYADAQLGALGYRIMIECKTAKGSVSQPDAAEAAKFREVYNAQYCTLIGPAFPNEVELTTELHTHGVSAWTVSDLKTALSVGANPYELRALFEPGYASDGLEDLLWDRAHGESKRVRVVADLVCAAGRNLQVISARQGTPADATRLTVDAAMALADEALAQQGSHQGVTRAEVQLAFEYLTNPRVRQAVWLDEKRDAIVLISVSSP